MEEETWNLAKLEESAQRFWSKFVEEKPDLQEFAIAQRNCFPQSFMDNFIDRLSKSRWTPNLKSQYQESEAAQVMSLAAWSRCKGHKRWWFSWLVEQHTRNHAPFLYRMPPTPGFMSLDRFLKDLKKHKR
ncbi:unnamed protein product [Microthlaspi erraticum]|uniref:Uncharacterized protein n=1 Tax=Microthlaspi erraticum TaxID=1685480 RepID=A0A6D2HBR2_9BRAS|nr:unnamed protein product [Microthlaspi erraticum]